MSSHHSDNSETSSGSQTTNHTTRQTGINAVQPLDSRGQTVYELHARVTVTITVDTTTETAVDNALSAAPTITRTTVETVTDESTDTATATVRTVFRVDTSSATAAVTTAEQRLEEVPPVESVSDFEITVPPFSIPE